MQKVGNAVHINVQLIEAATDAHLWAESYDRELQNIFGVEGEVAGAIAEALNAKLTGAEVKAVTARPTTNVAAYEAYLRAVATQANHWDYPASQEAAEDYAEAVRLDPQFALAWARMASVRSYLYFNGVDLARSSPAIIKDAADRARVLQPDLGEGWIAQGYYRYRVLRDFNGALKAFAKAGEKMPGNGDLFLARALIERRLGRFDAAEDSYKKALEKSPRDINILDSFASECLAPQRRFREAQAVFDRATGISPRDIATLAGKASAYQAEGRLAEAGQLAQIPADCEDDSVRLTQAQQFIYERKFAEAVTALLRDTTAPKSGEPLSSGRKCLLPLLGYAQQWFGRAAHAHATFARAVS